MSTALNNNSTRSRVPGTVAISDDEMRRFYINQVSAGHFVLKAASFSSCDPLSKKNNYAVKRATI